MSPRLGLLVDKGLVQLQEVLVVVVRKLPQFELNMVELFAEAVAAIGEGDVLAQVCIQINLEIHTNLEIHIGLPGTQVTDNRRNGEVVEGLELGN